MTYIYKGYILDTIQDFLRKLGMKPHVHLVEISIFSLNNVIVRLTKIMNNLLEHLKIRTFKVIFCVKNWPNLSEKKNYEKYSTRRPTFIKKCF